MRISVPCIGQLPNIRILLNRRILAFINRFIDTADMRRLPSPIIIMIIIIIAIINKFPNLLHSLHLAINKLDN